MVVLIGGAVWVRQGVTVSLVSILRIDEIQGRT